MKINTLYHNKRTYLRYRKIEYIVIHYTAGTISKRGSALNIANYFKNSTSEGSADYVVDDETVYLCNSDIKNYYSWAVGGSKYVSMSTTEGGKYYGKCTNKNSISIEICSNKTNKNSLFATDTDWYFTDSALRLAAELTRKLMSDYNIPLERVIMHHQVTGKICPNPFCVNQQSLSNWNSFKNLITTISEEEDAEMITETNISVNGKDIKINRILKDGKNYIDIRGLESAGFKIGYNNNTKLITLDNEIKELKLTVDNVETSVEAVNIKGHNYSPIRSISAATKAFVVDYSNNKVVINTFKE